MFAWQRHWIEVGFDALETMLARDTETGAFCHGDTPTIADICLIPQVANARRVNLDIAPWPTIARIEAHALQASRLRRRPAEEPARCRVTRRRASTTRLDLDHFVPYRLSVLSNRVSDAIARHYSERFGLSIPEWRVMAVLGQTPGLSARDVAARTAMDKVQVSRAVACLLRTQTRRARRGRRRTAASRGSR